MGERREGLDGEAGREEKKMREAEVDSKAHEGRIEEGKGPRGGKGRGNGGREGAILCNSWSSDVHGYALLEFYLHAYVFLCINFFASR